MFGSSHFQALKNNLLVSWHNFFHFFNIFNIFVPSPAENKKKKQKEVSGDLFRDLGP